MSNMNNTHIQTEIFCVHCGQLYTILLSKAGIKARQNGAFVQDAFPELTAGERELLISGTCDACWERFFPSELDE
jgi:hypothetical protein